jgi:glycosyltransferase involved in cell wall biosynthesis
MNKAPHTNEETWNPSSFPTISVITPSFNQGKFLERTILSVLNQNYPNLEFIIIDGGSSDESVDIIRKYSDRLTYWVSEPDCGQVDAINKGFKCATGEWLCWQNSDDIFLPGAFDCLAENAIKHPSAGLIIGNMVLIDENNRPLRELRYVKPDHKGMLAEGMLLANQAAFWRRELQDRIGLLDESYQCSFDYDWFLRLTAVCNGVHINRTLGALRLHSETKTSNQANLFSEENRRILSGREVSWWRHRAFQIKRLWQTLCRGDLVYILRGVFRRLAISLGMGH